MYNLGKFLRFGIVGEVFELMNSARLHNAKAIIGPPEHTVALGLHWRAVGFGVIPIPKPVALFGL